ncbi:flagellar hook-associated protein FlgK [Oceanidesulfovibrio marinus]|uniref:Flagellar hook-associated protein 1 n=1 Tax=Oceanidesulfovibrio marinus TaxID=370038 RepID=A0A6P1ZI35_9BACT|nr:flagellar hook-associated protein FlgK [Oceanidesulfovibrio marinus]QJT10615.1 flagellar hook-associated protein FlgK [Oceanidesulfovibrio marinus]TVM34156.1 flagellar hook-associated protein FlgK [Oceanidesulfovibrio marinus]
MAIGINSLLDMGKWALFGNQAAIATTGSNISNVHTEGYSRREVRFDEAYSIDYRPGQIGTGVVASEVIRHFDEFVEMQYVGKNADQSRFEALWANLQGVDNLFDESVADGLGASIDKFFQDWQDLSLRAEDPSTREQLLSDSYKLISLMRNMDSDLSAMQKQAEDQIQSEVNEVNDLLKRIADINKQIDIHDVPGSNNANQLYDERALLVRKLSEKIDIRFANQGSPEFTQTNQVEMGAGTDFAIMTEAGQTLVHGSDYYEIKFEGPRAMQSLIPSSNFDGDIEFSGSSDFEYTVEVIRGGQVSNASGAGTAQFRVSLDGGQTWLKGADGKEKIFYARPEGGKIGAGDLEIWFENATQDLEAGDKFSIMPRSGVYWYQNTSSFMNISPQIRGDGSDDPRRLQGGSVTGLMNFVGYVGQYRDKLDGLVKSMVWNVNRLHSQGTGLNPVSQATGTYSVSDPNVALGSDSSGLPMRDFLGSNAGNVTLYVYDESTGELVSGGGGNPVFGPLDFDTATPGIQNFDPNVHSLQDVVDAIDNTFGPYLDAEIVDNKLRINAADGYDFAFGADTSGLMAALGVNTFFTGSNMTDFGLNDAVMSNPEQINAGQVNGAFEGNEGDNGTALAIAALATKAVTVVSSFGVSNTQTLGEYYGNVMAQVGADTSTCKFTYEYNRALASDLNDRQEQVAGVNLDEEMANLIKYQHAYRAAAKLVTTADEMLQTVLGLKQ